MRGLRTAKAILRGRHGTTPDALPQPRLPAPLAPYFVISGPPCAPPIFESRFSIFEFFPAPRLPSIDQPSTTPPSTSIPPPAFFHFRSFHFNHTFLPIDTALPQQNPSFVRQTFSAIAKRYDLANHVLSGGADFLWRAKAARIVAASNPRRILDLATGSGDLAKTLREHCPQAQIVGADFCLPMLEVARDKSISGLVQADGMKLPFRSDTFDALTVAFGLRNMASWETALREMCRVLRPGSLLLVMDFSLPEFAPFRAVYRAYLHHGLPRLAALVTGNRDAYEYLAESIESFPRGAEMLSLVEKCGFNEPRRALLLNGIASIYTACKR